MESEANIEYGKLSGPDRCECIGDKDAVTQHYAQHRDTFSDVEVSYTRRHSLTCFFPQLVSIVYPGKTFPQYTIHSSFVFAIISSEIYIVSDGCVQEGRCY